MKAILFAAVAGIGLVGGGVLVGYTAGRTEMSNVIARQCASEKQFTLDRGGIVWTYACTKPKVSWN